MHPGLFMSPPWRRIGIRPAANGDQRHRTGMIGFQHIRCEAGPVAADLIELAGFRGAMAGIIGEHGDEFSVGVVSRQHGNSFVGRAIGNFAESGPLAIRDHSSIHCKPASPKPDDKGPGRRASMALSTTSTSFSISSVSYREYAA